jgi:protease-4
MWKQMTVVVLMGCSLVMGKPGPTTVPTTKPATQPTTKSVKPAAKTFPTAAEMAKKILAKRDAEASKSQVAYFDLTTAVREKPADFSLFGEESQTLRELIARIDAAKDDPKVNAVLIYLGSGTGLKMAQVQEVRESLTALRRAGKKTFAYADSYDATGFMLASACTNVCLLEGGEIFIPGIGFETMFYKGSLDKLGVQADYVQIGEYKGAEEPFTRSGPSEELKSEMNKLVDSYYKQIVDTISLNRNLSNEKVKRVVDNAILSGRQAKDAGWVDHLVDADGMRDLMKAELNNDVNVLHHYGIPERQPLDLSNPFAIFQLMMQKEPVSDLPKIAVVYAEGAIMDGQGGEGMLGGMSVGSEDIRTAMRLASRDEKVKAIVIRIDSPGGSALASEAMWQSVRRVAKDKPVIVSIGSMAASGGYYLASAGEYIVADPSAIVGSIGVVGGKFVMNDLYEKLGITTQTFQRGQNAGLFSSTERFDDRQKRMVRTWMKNTYDQFTDRIKETRGKKIKDIDEVARGRIFLAEEAKGLGMVDELGGLTVAINHAAKRAKLEKGEYDVTVLPKPTTIADILNGTAGADASMPAFAPRMKIEIKPDALLRVLPANVRDSLGQQLQLMEILEARPVAVMAPFIVKE